MNEKTVQPKQHFEILDGLRGVAAVMVVIFHLFEAHSNASHFEQIVNHGYLAVDFFFLLSGFVIGYAYDDRWGNISIGNFFKRRLIRLQPMVVMGMIVGALLFYFQASPTLFPMIQNVPVWKVFLVMLFGFTLLPLPTSLDIRGWQEMHPLNGPGWSLFFEYIANIAYALVIRRFSKTMLSIFVFLTACLLIHYTVTAPLGDVIGGWSLEPVQLRIGFTRMLYPFFAGLLLFRIGKLVKINNAFLWSSLLLIAILAFPRVGGKENVWTNGLYESFSIIVLFPLVVFIGASGTLTTDFSKKISKFLGEISYPIYITHYPLIYIYTAWVIDNKVPMTTAYPYAILVLISSISLAYACLKWFDEPVRKKLKEYFGN